MIPTPPAASTCSARWRRFPSKCFTWKHSDPASCEVLREAIFRATDVIRVYTKSPGKPADYSSPFTIPSGGTVEDLAYKVHRDLAEKVKSAKVWTHGSPDPHTVGKDHILADRDLVELHA